MKYKLTNKQGKQKLLQTDSSGGAGAGCGLDDILYGLSWKVSSSVGHMERMYVTYLLDRMDNILGCYRYCKKKKKQGQGQGHEVWTYYKRIPSRYWHEMLEAYEAFRETLGSEVSLRFGVRQSVFSDAAIMKMALYVRLLPSLGRFDKCRSVRGGRFGLCRQILYDHMSCLVD
jgi:hypothetical protein